jgi:hypothetical protein
MVFDTALETVGIVAARVPKALSTPQCPNGVVESHAFRPSILGRQAKETGVVTVSEHMLATSSMSNPTSFGSGIVMFTTPKATANSEPAGRVSGRAGRSGG